MPKEEITHDVASDCVKEAYEEATNFYNEHKDDVGIAQLTRIVFQEILRHKLKLIRKWADVEDLECD